VGGTGAGINKKYIKRSQNKAFIDIRLRPGIATSLVVLCSAFYASPYGPLRPNVTSSI